MTSPKMGSVEAAESLLSTSEAIRYSDVDKCARSHALSDSIAKRNELRSPFLRIPPEIRNQIYGYIFCEGMYVFIIGKRNRKDRVRSRGIKLDDKYPYPIRQSIRLLSVCRKIHHEAALLPFSLNSFHFHTLATLQQFDTLITPKQRTVIKSIYLLTSPGDPLSIDLYLLGMQTRGLKFSGLYPSVRKIYLQVIARDRYRHFLVTEPGLEVNKKRMSLEQWLQDGSDEELEIHLID